MSALTSVADCLHGSLAECENVAYAGSMTGNLDDSALMLRYKDGDMGAFDVLYRRHNDSLYRYLLRLSQNPATAEDLFQEAWGKIVKSRENYRPTARFSTFLFRVAHNCFIDYVRRNKRHTAEVSVDPYLSPTADDSPEYLTERHLARRRLSESLAQIPAEQRDVFLLHEEAGLSIEEIATVTGVNRETAKSRLRYAVGKLTIALAPAEPEEL